MMKEAVVQRDLSVQIKEVPIPQPGPGQVLIKINCAGCNPKDWKLPVVHGRAANSGDDMAGTIAEVGEGVVEFKAGDRVAAMHVMWTEHGSFAEYGIAPAGTTFHLPVNTSFEEAATIPLAALTSAVALYHDLDLPPPWNPARKPTSLVIYGASGAVGAFAVKLARKSNIHPIIAIAGKSKDFVQSLIDPTQGDIVVDYRDGAASTVEAVHGCVKGLGLAGVEYAFDAIANADSVKLVTQLVQPGGHVDFIDPRRDYSTVPEGILTSSSFVGVVHGQGLPNDTLRHIPAGNGPDFGYIYSRLFTRGLEEGWLVGHPSEVQQGGLNDLSEALKNLKGDKISGKKYIFKIY